jgi:hypothetical protein
MPMRLGAENSIASPPPACSRRSTVPAGLGAGEFVGLGQHASGTADLAPPAAGSRRAGFRRVRSVPAAGHTAARCRAGSRASPGSWPSPAASGSCPAWARRHSRNRAGRPGSASVAPCLPTANRLMCCVRPGLRDAKASCFCCVSVLMQVDLPAFERPTKAISGTLECRQEMQFRCRGQEAGGMQPAGSGWGAGRGRRGRLRATPARGVEVVMEWGGVAPGSHCRIARCFAHQTPIPMKLISHLMLAIVLTASAASASAQEAKAARHRPNLIWPRAKQVTQSVPPATARTAIPPPPLSPSWRSNTRSTSSSSCRSSSPASATTRS